MTQMAKIRPNDVYADIEPEDVSLDRWTNATNIQFRNNAAERVNGYLSVFPQPPSRPVHLVPNLTPVASYWLYALANNNIRVTDGTADFTITPTPAPAPTITDPWTSCILNGVAVMNAGSGAPFYWDNQTGNPMQSLPGWQSGHSCRVIRAYKNYLIALAYNDGVAFIPDRFAWSDAAPPGSVPSTWAPAATNDAGDQTLSDQPGEILDGQSLRDQFIVYAKNAVYTLNFIGGNDIFAQRKLFSTIGILGRNCVVESRGFHYVLSENDVVVHDGQRPRSLVDRRWRRTLFSRIDSALADLSYVLHYEAANEVWFCVPLTGAAWPNAALVYNYYEQRLGWREFDECAHGANGAFPIGSATTIDGLLGTIDGLVGPIDQLSDANAQSDQLVLCASAADGFYHVDAAGDLNGTPIAANLGRYSMDLEVPDRYKLVRRIWHRLVNGDVELRIGTQNYPYEPINWGQWLPCSGDYVDVLASGRLISVEFRSVAGSQWRTSGFDIEYRTGGRF